MNHALARLAVFFSLGVVLVLEYVLACWLVIDGIHGPHGPLGDNTLQPQFNPIRAALLSTLIVVGVGLHLRHRAHAGS